MKRLFNPEYGQTEEMSRFEAFASPLIKEIIEEYKDYDLREVEFELIQVVSLQCATQRILDGIESRKASQPKFNLRETKDSLDSFRTNFGGIPGIKDTTIKARGVLKVNLTDPDAISILPVSYQEMELEYYHEDVLLPHPGTLLCGSDMGAGDPPDSPGAI